MYCLFREWGRPDNAVGFDKPAVNTAMSVPPQMRTVPTIILFLIFFFRRTLPKMMFVTNCIDSKGASMTEGAKAYDAKFSKAPVTKTVVPITQVRDSLGSRAGFSAASLPPLSSSSSSSRFWSSFKPMDCKLLPVLMAIEPNRPRTNPSAMDHNGSSTVSRSSSVKTGWLGAAVGAPVDAMRADGGRRTRAPRSGQPRLPVAAGGCLVGLGCRPGCPARPKLPSWPQDVDRHGVPLRCGLEAASCRRFAHSGRPSSGCWG